ncbi:unnamed protein product [Linum trigynum]|uniref:Secreted protein n=1 Tax=Linum trigynum TaxID=586398 RepID=A0AAV2FR08_9ROSI
MTRLFLAQLRPAQALNSHRLLLGFLLVWTRGPIMSPTHLSRVASITTPGGIQCPLDCRTDLPGPLRPLPLAHRSARPRPLPQRLLVRRTDRPSPLCLRQLMCEGAIAFVVGPNIWKTTSPRSLMKRHREVALI